MTAMTRVFTNAHAHIFTANHAPDFFLKTVIPNATLARWVDKFLQKDGTRWAVKGVLQLYAAVSRAKRPIIRRYLEFVQIGTSVSQTDIFEKINQSYAQFQDHKIIVLTQVLDYLDLADTSSAHIRIKGQVEEVVELKRNARYQRNIFPFLGVDPRQTGFRLLEDWVSYYIDQKKGFYGIKIYPAAGFFPFDSRLDPLWEWAQENQAPVMTHTTRSGSFYLGSFDSILNSGALQLNDLDPDDALEKGIIDRVNSVIDDKSIHKKNELWCNIFGYPDNYEVVLRKYPDLKICLAHLGGASEINRQVPPTGKCDCGKPPKYPPYLEKNWYPMVLDLMKRYKNIYSDISYTLSCACALDTVVKQFRQPDATDGSGQPLINRLMYGTDFYLTQQEELGDEADLQGLFLGHFTQKEVQALAYDNPERYLRSVIWP